MIVGFMAFANFCFSLAEQGATCSFDPSVMVEAAAVRHPSALFLTVPSAAKFQNCLSFDGVQGLAVTTFPVAVRQKPSSVIFS